MSEMSVRFAEGFEDMQEAAHRNSVDHGWYEGEEHLGRGASTEEEKRQRNNIIAAKIALIHSEISEALEEVREGKLHIYYKDGNLPRKPEGAEVEFADAIIRIMDLAGWLDLNVADAIVAKHEYNKGRPFRHGGKAL